MIYSVCVCVCVHVRLGSLKHQERKHHVLLSFLPPFAGMWATRSKDGGLLVGGQWVHT